MSIAKITETYLDDIADAIRFKRMESSATYTPPQMASAIMSIAGGPNAVYVTDTIDPETGGIIRVINGTDISTDTVTPETLLSGITAHMSDGTAIIGEYTGGGGGVLPEGYIQLPAVQGPTGAIIDTGIQPNQSTIAEFKITPLSVTGDVLLGVKGADDSHDWRIFNHNQTIYWDCYSTRVYGSTFSTGVTRELRVENNKVIDLSTSTTLLTGTTVASFSLSYNIGINGGFGNTTTYANAIWQYVKIYQGEDLVRDFIPCMEDSTKTYGMYDLVGSSFYSTAGTEQFQSPYQIKSVSFVPAETQITSSVTADGIYTALQKVNITVSAISSTYVGSAVTRRTATDLTASGSTVTAPSGYYSSAVTKSIAPASNLFVGNFEIESNGETSVLVEIESGGYISAKEEWFPLDTLAVVSAQTLYPSTADQTISSYRWITGSQTLKSVTYTGLTAGNIVSGVTVKIGDSANPSRIVQIVGTASTGGIDTSDATATAGDILSPKTAYASGAKLTGTIQTKTSSDVGESGRNINIPQGYFSQATTYKISTSPMPDPSISVNYSTGLITATVTLDEDTEGYHEYPASGQDTLQLLTKSATTYNTSTANQTIGSGQYLTGNQTILGVTTSNLSAQNIVAGVTIKVGDSGNASRIAQVTGTATIGTDTTDATLTSGGQMLSAYTAYAKGTKYTGTIPTKTSADLTASGLVVTVPSGYYSQATTKEVSLTTGTLTSSIADDVQMMSMYAYTNSSAYFSSAKVVYFPQMTVSSATTVTVNADGDVTTKFSPSTAGAAFTKATYTVTKSSALHVMSSADYGFQFNGVDANNLPLITVDANNEGYQFNDTFALTGDISISTQGASTYYVSTADRTIASSKWLTGAQTIKSVTTSNITASNIVSGVVVRVGDTGNASRILQVTGTAQTGTDTSDATLSNANQLISGVTAYAGGSKYTGTLVVHNYYTGNAVPGSSLGNAGDIYLQYDDGTGN